MKIFSSCGCLLAIAVSSASPVRGGGWGTHGVVFGAGEGSSPSAPLGSAAANASLRAAAAAGANALQLRPAWFIDAPRNGTTMHRGGQPAGSPYTTPLDSGVRSALALARALNMSVTLCPLLEPNWALEDENKRGPPGMGYPGAACLLWRKGKFPGMPQPPGCEKNATAPVATVSRADIGSALSCGEGGGAGSWDAWFAAYGAAVVLPYARLAEEAGASVFSVATGLEAALVEPCNAPRWAQLITDVRAVFSGRVTAAGAELPPPPAVVAELDIIGVVLSDGLGALSPAAQAEPPTITELASAWAPYAAALRTASAAAAKPVMGLDVGFQSRPRSFAAPGGAARRNTGDCSVYLPCYSMGDQALAYEALYRAFGSQGGGAGGGYGGNDNEDAWFEGVFFFGWRSDNSSGGTSDQGFTPRGKPAELSMRGYAARHGLNVTALQAAPSAVPPDTPPREDPGRLPRPLTRRSQWSAKENGIVFGSGEWSSFELLADDGGANANRTLGSAAARRSLLNARAVGVNSVEFVPTWYFPADCDATGSTAMYRGQQSRGSATAQRALRTDTDAELRAGVALAQSLGLNTTLSPMFDPDYGAMSWWNGTGGVSGNDDVGVHRGKWGEGWNASQASAWFAAYGDIIVAYAALSEACGVGTLHVAHELHTLVTTAAYEPQWRVLIKRVRAAFPSGRVSVAFNGNPFFDDVAKGFGWLDALDHIGIDCYWPLLTELPPHSWQAASVAEIVAAWQPLVTQMANVSAAHGGLGIVCTEVGYQSRPYSWIRGLNGYELDPWDCDGATGSCVNLEAQANVYEALITALYPHDWFLGVYLWLWKVDPTAGGTSDDAYTPQGKPASQRVLKELWT